MLKLLMCIGSIHIQLMDRQMNLYDIVSSLCILVGFRRPMWHLNNQIEFFCLRADISYSLAEFQSFCHANR